MKTNDITFKDFNIHDMEYGQWRSLHRLCRVIFRERDGYKVAICQKHAQLCVYEEPASAAEEKVIE